MRKSLAFAWTKFNVSKFILSLFSFYYLRYFTWGLVINITLYPVPMPDTIQGAKKVIFTACNSCHSLAQTSFQLAPKTFWWTDWFHSSSVIWIPPKASLALAWISPDCFESSLFSVAERRKRLEAWDLSYTCPSGKLIKEFTSPIAKYPLAPGYRTLLSLHAATIVNSVQTKIATHYSQKRYKPPSFCWAFTCNSSVEYFSPVLEIPRARHW